MSQNTQQYNIIELHSGVPLVGPGFGEADWQFKALKEEYK